MSAITPDSFVKLVRFDVTKENQITFPDGVAQVNYFLNAEGIEASDFTYVRQEGKIRFPYVIDYIEKYNYVVVQNTPYNYKYYFYYITDMKYVNDEMTDVFIKLDVFQTFQFDFIYKQSFVEREHVNDDTIGKHTIPEGLETGEYVVNTYQYYDRFDSQVLVVLASTPVDANGMYAQDVHATITNLNGVYYYGKCYICENPFDLTNLLWGYTVNTYSGGVDSINSMYLVPRSCINWSDISHVYMPEIEYQDIKEYYSTAPMVYTESFTKPSTLNGYSPKNKKLLTYPYCFLLISNNNGNSNIFHYEKWKSANCQVSFSCVPTAGASIKMSPYLYTENQGYDEEEGLIAGKFPMLNWNIPEYATWLNRNALNLTGQIVVGGTQIVTGAVSGNVEGVFNGLTNTLGVVKQMYEHKMQPDSARGNINGADVNIASDQNGFYFYKKSIKKEFAQIIDNFFSKFGYKVNLLKVPNISGRENWNYVKLIEANVEGNIIPEKYLNEYKQMLNKGITFWHNPATFLDYSQNNPII